MLFNLSIDSQDNIEHRGVLLDIGYFWKLLLLQSSNPLSLRPSINETKLPEEARQGSRLIGNASKV
jgi:hypothetical protein